MKIFKNTLKVEWDRWDDPGDYPSNAGAGPLPSRDYIVDVSGFVLLSDFVTEDIVKILESGDESILDLVNETLSEVKVIALEYSQEQGYIKATVVAYVETD